MAIYGQSDGTIFSMKRIIAVTLTVLAVLGLSGSSAQKQSLDGSWRSEGYGMVFDIQGATLKSFEVTATTCVPGDTGQREDTSIDGHGATFKTTEDFSPVSRKRTAQQFGRTCKVGLADLSQSNRSNQTDSRKKCLGLYGHTLALYRSEDASRPRSTGFCEDH